MSYLMRIIEGKRDKGKGKRKGTKTARKGSRRINLMSKAKFILLMSFCALALPNFASAQASATEWKPLFDGKTLSNWKSTKFSGEGPVKVENGQIVLEAGTTLTGITWTGP